MQCPVSLLPYTPSPFLTSSVCYKYGVYLVHWFQVHQLFCLEACVFRPVAALTAVVAVLRAATCLNTQQRAALDLLKQGEHSMARHGTAQGEGHPVYAKASYQLLHHHLPNAQQQLWAWIGESTHCS